ncbi:D-alanine--D-alanine ligase family protein [Pseudaminobacter soli (ex Li et al. 2025)]|uniref:D-alanine--D-alanine ligase n=1 Tax=Pseudaminobacter soli (ex Li et al. 2025) TaxID=1295366 RepID=A0A2P7SIK2_9HYPH|nr:D-alanine--D-alanine ligase family protein [Mesorhizobium soli]PSJ62326.1 D-alanine--D-alanine ligase A [Mesorhizobium soli]
MTSKPRVAVLFGGRSAEHEVSILSASNVVKAIDPARYEVVPIGIGRDGRWFLTSLGADGALPKVPETGTEASLLPGGQGRLVAVPDNGAPYELPKIDVLFPVLHGPFGEDGTVQGLAEVANVPYVGCGVLGSANAMDKDAAKRLMRDAGLPVARAVTVHAGERPSFEAVKAELGLPVFVKPARQGSSVGVSKVETEAQFGAALGEAFRHDRKVLVEEFVAGREVEFAVLEQADGTYIVSVPGEIVPAASHGFYTYEAKYVDAAGAALRIPAELPEAEMKALQDIARKAFLALGCEGMARVDFFVRADGSALVNELNTIPGFTNISMYPKTLAASGIAYPDLVGRLIEHAVARWQRQG